MYVEISIVVVVIIVLFCQMIFWEIELNVVHGCVVMAERAFTLCTYCMHPIAYRIRETIKKDLVWWEIKGAPRN